MEGERYLEVLPKFVHRVAPTTKGLARVKRRFRQFMDAAFHPDFESSSSLSEVTAKRYSTQDEIDFYRHYVSFGWHSYEMLPVQKALESLEPGSRVLIVGCGTGRECFALEAMGLKVVGIDICQRMIDVANELKQEMNSQVEFLCGDLMELESLHPFPLVIPTFGLNNHIQGKGRRVALLQKLIELTRPDGRIVFYRDDQGFSWHSRFYVISQVLRIRWWKRGIWERGDTLRSFLGPHNNTQQMIYWHYYPSPQDLDEELREAGFFEPQVDGRVIYAKTSESMIE